VSVGQKDLLGGQSGVPFLLRKPDFFAEKIYFSRNYLLKMVHFYMESLKGDRILNILIKSLVIVFGNIES